MFIHPAIRYITCAVVHIAELCISKAHRKNKHHKTKNQQPLLIICAAVHTREINKNVGKTFNGVIFKPCTRIYD